MFCGATTPLVPRLSYCPDLEITPRNITLGTTTVDEGSARRRNLYLTKHNIHRTQTFMSSAGFEPAIPTSERPQAYVLERAATEISVYDYY